MAFSSIASRSSTAKLFGVRDHMLEISPLTEFDYDRWEVLARGYMTFYSTVRTDAEYESLWARILERKEILGTGARLAGELVGICHYLFHASAWSGDICFLQDLFVLESARGKGIGRKLIEHVANEARANGSPRLYWHTHQSNSVARSLYDQVASNSGFIRYEKSLV